MKITHIALIGPVTDNWTYQDNLLPKYHKLNGHDVSMITSQHAYDTKGNTTLDKRSKYINENGIKTIRLRIKNNRPLQYRFKKYVDLYNSIELEKPDVLFVHGLQFMDISTIVKYAKNNSNVKIYVDNHADFSNSAKNWLSKNILHKIIWRKCAHKIMPYATKFYGVLPARVDFLKNVYKLPQEKVGLLVMGAEDERVEEAKLNESQSYIRNKCGLKKDDFVIITGGKIDNAKKQTLLLMQAVGSIPEDRIKLIVFGSVIDELKEQVNNLSDGNRVKYIGWVEASDSYKYFGAANLVIFPGRHSVFWEQVAGLGIPMIVKYWEGTTHVDLGGNCLFLYKDSVEEIKKAIINIACDVKLYEEMKNVAEGSLAKAFLYSEIARKSITPGS